MKILLMLEKSSECLIERQRQRQRVKRETYFVCSGKLRHDNIDTNRIISSFFHIYDFYKTDRQTDKHTNISTFNASKHHHHILPDKVRKRKRDKHRDIDIYNL